MRKILDLFVGYDPREEIGSHVFLASVLAHTTIPVRITHLGRTMLERRLGEHFSSGSNDFTTTRFLVPYLMDFSGFAVFMDGADMVTHGDLAELLGYEDPLLAVRVVQHDYKTRHPRKYRGSSMESDNQDYARKQWASVMMFNCAHPAWRKYTPEFVAQQSKLDLLQFKGFHPASIGSLPLEWNWLVDEMGPNDHAKVLHWTAGVPVFPGHRDAPMATDWLAYHTRANYAVS